MNYLTRRQQAMIPYRYKQASSNSHRERLELNSKRCIVLPKWFDFEEDSQPNDVK